MLPLVLGTFLVTGIAIAVAILLGLGAAIYLNQYAHPRVRKTIKPALELLAGVPTIVFGYFALTFFTPNILQDPGQARRERLQRPVGRDHLGFMVIPAIVGLRGRDVGVPQSLREGAFGLGASKLQVSLRVVFPAALSGIVPFSRARDRGRWARRSSRSPAGLVAVSLNPGEPHYTLTSYIAAIGKGDVATTAGQETIFAVGTTLFVITLIMNAISIRFVRKYRQVPRAPRHTSGMLRGRQRSRTAFVALPASRSVGMLGLLLVDVAVDGGVSFVHHLLRIGRIGRECGRPCSAPSC